MAMTSLLLSPHFVFRVELDDQPTSLSAHPLTDYELASRLSYFLWSSMPDDLLFADADAGALQDPVVLRKTVLRMLADERASALVENFAGQWLHVRAIDNADPDPWFYDGFDDEIRESMRGEANRFFRTFMTEGRDMVELLTAKDSFVDARLAKHYGLPAVSKGYKRVFVDGVHRGGILRQGALLTSLSYPTRTSPVQRGKWVLGQLLCAEPPPPPGVESLGDEESDKDLPLRERLAMHRTKPECAACHASMDPIGLGLEQFDGIGQWRTKHGKYTLDPSGELPGAGAFKDADALIGLLAADSRLPSCMVRQVMTYALGRGLLASDDPHIVAIEKAFVAGGRRFVDLVTLVVTSEPFRMRRGEPSKEAKP